MFSVTVKWSYFWKYKVQNQGLGFCWNLSGIKKDRAVADLAIVSLCAGREDTFPYMFMSHQSGCWFPYVKILSSAQLSSDQLIQFTHTVSMLKALYSGCVGSGSSISQMAAESARPFNIPELVVRPICWSKLSHIFWMEFSLGSLVLFYDLALGSF